MVRSPRTQRMLLLICLAIKLIKLINVCENAHNFPPFAKAPHYRPFCGSVSQTSCTNISATHVHLIKSEPKFSHAWTCKPKPRQTVNLLLLILLGGDVETNPGPGPWIKYPCGICRHAVKTNCPAIQCDNCDTWIHNTCSGLTNSRCQSYLSNSNLTFICPKCQLPTFLRNMNLTLETSSNPFETLQNSDSFTDSLPNIRSPNQFRPAPNATSSPRKRRVHREAAKKLRVMSVNCNSIQSTNKRAELSALIDHHNPHILGQESKLGNFSR